VDYLDKSGIVVRNGRAAELEPSFTQLSNFPANKSLAGPTDAFDPAFSAGVHSERAYLAAVDNRGMAQPTELKDFQAIWDRTSPKSRIFVSFGGKELRAPYFWMHLRGEVS